MKNLIPALLVAALAAFGQTRDVSPRVIGTRTLDQTGDTLTDISTPSAPPAGKTKTYTKGGKLCSLDSNGSEYCTGTGGGGTGTPGGSNTQVQFNDAGSFGGNAGFVFDKLTGDLTISGTYKSSYSGTSEQVFKEGTVPSNPSAGQFTMWVNQATHIAELLNSAGTSVPFVMDTDSRLSNARTPVAPTPTTLGGLKSGQCTTTTGKLMGYDTNGDRICETDQTGAGGGTIKGTEWVHFVGQLDANAGRISLTMGSGSSEVSAPSFFTGSNYALTGQRFQDGVTQTMYVTYRLHPSWTGAINLNFEGFTGSATGPATAIMNASTACPAAGAAMNPATYNTAQQFTVTNVNNTALVRRTSTLSNLTTTGCNAGDLMILKIQRLGADGSDNMTTDVYLMGMQVEFFHN